MEYDSLKIRSKSLELENYSGYLPWIIRREIDLDNYQENLEKKGVYDNYKDELSESMMSSYKKHKEEFLLWIKSNPKYREFLIEK